MPDKPVTLEEARAAKGEIQQRLAHVPGIVGVGLTKVGDSYAVKVNVDASAPSALPGKVGPVAVVVEFVGEIQAH